MVSRNTQKELKKYGRAFRFLITLSVFFVIYISVCIFLTKPLNAKSLIIRSLAFRGNRIFSNQELKEMVKSREGSTFDLKQFENDLETIVLNYYKEGYKFARIDEPTRGLRFFPDGIYIMIEIDEGIIGEIMVYGNDHTKDKVIIRELLFKEGDVYNREDEQESERILRRKKYLGKAEIIATRNDITGKVDLLVEVVDLWTLFPSVSLPVFDEDSDISVALSDTNVLGFGQKVKLRYKYDTEISENSISGSFVEPRLFSSHLRLDCSFAKKMDEIPWEVRLVRPFYSLETDWGMEFMGAKQVNTLKWLSPQTGKVLEEIVRERNIRHARYTYSFGERKSKFGLSLWGIAQEKKFSSQSSYADYQDGITNMIGLSFSRAEVNFVKETYLNKLGQIEDIQLGYNYGMSAGYASESMGSDEKEIKLMIHSIYSKKYGERNFLDVEFHLQTHRIFDNQRDTIADINVRYFLQDVLWQTLAVRFAGRLGDNLKTRQLILDTRNDIRGYGDKRVVGEKIAILNIEDRMVFFKHPYFVIGGVVFADIGGVWGPSRPERIIKKSVGIGLRIGIPELSGSPVYRLDWAYALDESREFSFARGFSFAIGHFF